MSAREAGSADFWWTFYDIPASVPLNYSRSSLCLHVEQKTLTLIHVCAEWLTEPGRGCFTLSSKRFKSLDAIKYMQMMEYSVFFCVTIITAQLHGLYSYSILKELSGVLSLIKPQPPSTVNLEQNYIFQESAKSLIITWRSLLYHEPELHVTNR